MNDKKKCEILQKNLQQISSRNIKIMEVCGSHTMSMAKHGIRSFLPKNIEIISGPGCPVCVTDESELARALELAADPNNIIATFGDMLKIPVNGVNLSSFNNIKLIYSPIDSLKLAIQNPTKNIILLGIGFETTIPLIAETIIQASNLNLDNFFVLPIHKLVPPAVDAIFQNPQINIDGLLLPGHVSVITGWDYFSFITKYNVSGVVAGFEPIELLEAITILVNLINAKTPKVINHHPGLVKKEGNKVALKKVAQVYAKTDSPWRKIGTIALSGLKIKPAYAAFDAFNKFTFKDHPIKEVKGCLCGNIMMGQKSPLDCALYKKVCTPTNPIGPCMVSNEGTCAAYYKYHVT